MKFLFSFVLLTLLIVPFSLAQVVEDTDDIITVETRLVSVPVMISDRDGRFVSGMKRENFKIYQDGVEQEIAFFGDNREPINIALLLDTSYSTIEAIDRIKSAAIDFVKQLNKSDRAMIISFDTDIKVLGALTSDRSDLINSINRAKAENVSGTVMRKAVNDVINPLFAEVKGRKAIILLTDGKDFGSSISESELLYNLEESELLVYSIFYSTELAKYQQFDPAIINSRMKKNIPGAGVQRGEATLKRIEQITKYNREATDFLTQMSELTAGRFYERDVTDLKETFKIIVDELRNQYRLGFYPPEEEVRGIVHQLGVKVDRKDVVVRARKTYRSRKSIP